MIIRILVLLFLLFPRLIWATEIVSGISTEIVCPMTKVADGLDLTTGTVNLRVQKINTGDAEDAYYLNTVNAWVIGATDLAMTYRYGNIWTRNITATSFSGQLRLSCVDTTPSAYRISWSQASYPAARSTLTTASVMPDTTGTGTLLTRIPGTVQPQTGDSYARLGAPTGASIAADIQTRSAPATAQTIDFITALPASPTADTVGEGLKDASRLAFTVANQVDSNDITKTGYTLTSAERENIIKSVSGTADSGSTTTIIDAERTEADTDYWVNHCVLITSGTTTGQLRRISAFNAATDTITVDTAFTQAILTNTYLILRSAMCPAGGGDSAATIWAYGGGRTITGAGTGALTSASFVAGAIDIAAVALKTFTTHATSSTTFSVVCAAGQCTETVTDSYKGMLMYCDIPGKQFAVFIAAFDTATDTFIVERSGGGFPQEPDNTTCRIVPWR